MKIGVNARFLLPKMEGFGWFSYEVVKRLCIEHPEHQFFLFFDRKYDPQFVFSSNVRPVVLAPQARHPVLFKIWFNFSTKRALKKYKIDLFFSPDGYLSLTSKIPQVPVIHDIYFEHYPRALKPVHFRYLHKYFPLFAEKANKIITVSEYSKADIAKTYGIDANKIHVVYNGATEDFKPLLEPEKQRIRKQYSQGEPYFLFVGALQPRKNLGNLLLAFDAFKKNNRSTFKLLVVGANYFISDEMKSIFAGLQHSNDVLFTGHLSKTELTQVMGSAEALAFVSYFEGFGIPIVEAMKAGCPVIVGNQTSCPEIAGDAALVCDPFDILSIQTALETLFTDDTLKMKLKSKGIERAKQFTWDNTARKVWDVLEPILQTLHHGTSGN